MTVTFTLSFVLLPYVLILTIMAAFAVFNLHHLFEHGGRNRLAYAVTTTFLAGVAAILLLTWQGLGQVNWRQPISLTPSLTGFGASNIPDTNAP